MLIMYTYEKKVKRVPWFLQMIQLIEVLNFIFHIFIAVYTLLKKT